MCSSLIDVAVRGEREEKFESEPGVRSYEPNEVETTLRNCYYRVKAATSRSFGLVLRMQSKSSKLCHLARERTP